MQKARVKCSTIDAILQDLNTWQENLRISSNPCSGTDPEVLVLKQKIAERIRHLVELPSDRDWDHLSTKDFEIARLALIWSVAQLLTHGPFEVDEEELMAISVDLVRLGNSPSCWTDFSRYVQAYVELYQPTWTSAPYRIRERFFGIPGI
jgi:hypothetical protein